MKPERPSNQRIYKFIVLVLLVAWMLPGVAKLIAANTLEIREDDYGVSLGTVYYRRHNTSSPTGAVRLTRIKDIDAKNFTNLGSGCIRDNDTLLCHGNPVPTIDRDTFKIHKVGNRNSRYASDINKVFCTNNLRVVNLEPDEIVVLGGGYAKDLEKAAFSCEVFVPRDIASFLYVSDEFAKDKKGVYFRSKLIPTADPNTFVVDDGQFDYSHDRNRYFHQEKEITKEEFGAHMKLLEDSQ